MINTKENDTVEYFIKNPDAYIREISIALKIPKSSIQRYLQKNSDTIIDTRGITIGDQLAINKLKGNKQGGDKSYIENDCIKDSEGKFVGSKKTTNKDKLDQKEKDIKLISEYYLNHKDLSLEEVANFFSEIELYTKSNVYYCLTSNRTKEILGEEIYSKIQENLKKNRTSNQERRIV